MHRQRFLIPMTVAALMVACGGNGNGKSQQVQPPDPPAAPVVTVDADIKQLIFSWREVAGATHYRLLENPDGHSGFTQAGDDIPAGTLTLTKPIAVHLHRWADALYIVQACNGRGCNDSSEITVKNLMLDTIGYIKASNTDPGDRFGASVALSSDGQTMAVGAPGEASLSAGIDGDQYDDPETCGPRNTNAAYGAVYIFRLKGMAWTQQAYIKASNPGCQDGFGQSLALNHDGNVIAVGAPLEDSSATGINGDQNDNSRDEAGAVYLYGFDGKLWSQLAYIKPSVWKTPWDAYFGTAVVLSGDGDTLAVGEPQHIEQDGAGTVYIFRFDGSDWREQAAIDAPDIDANIELGSGFGKQLALSNDGSTLAVTRPIGLRCRLELGCPQSKVHIYRSDGNLWERHSWVTASCPPVGTDDFGLRGLALSGDGETLAVPQGRNMCADRHNVDSGDRMCDTEGVVYVYRVVSDSWSEKAFITACNSDIPYGFGDSVALNGDGDALIVNTPLDISGAQGIDGDPHDDSAWRSGGVWVMRFDGETWVKRSYVKASNTEEGDHFGRAELSTDGNTLVVGAYDEDSASTGINGDQSDNSAPLAGAVYVY